MNKDYLYSLDRIIRLYQVRFNYKSIYILFSEENCICFVTSHFDFQNRNQISDSLKIVTDNYDSNDVDKVSRKCGADIYE